MLRTPAAILIDLLAYKFRFDIEVFGRLRTKRIKAINRQYFYFLLLELQYRSISMCFNSTGTWIFGQWACLWVSLSYQQWQYSAFLLRYIYSDRCTHGELSSSKNMIYIFCRDMAYWRKPRGRQPFLCSVPVNENCMFCFGPVWLVTHVNRPEIGQWPKAQVVLHVWVT